MSTEEVKSTSHSPIALVTGGTRGIGLGISKQLAADGFNLVLGYKSNHEAANAGKENLEKSYGIRVCVVGGNLAVQDAMENTVEKYFEAIEKMEGELEVFICNAGFYTSDMHLHHVLGGVPNFKTWDLFHVIYAKCFVKICENAVPLMRKHGRGGRIVTISSPGVSPNEKIIDSYDLQGQGKAAMEYLARVYAKKLAPEQICVNTVTPGFIETEAWEGPKIVLGEDMITQFGIDGTGAGRWGTTEDVGHLVAFLCSKKASFITGVNIPIDGGHFSRL